MKMFYNLRSDFVLFSGELRMKMFYNLRSDFVLFSGEIPYK